MRDAFETPRLTRAFPDSRVPAWRITASPARRPPAVSPASMCLAVRPTAHSSAKDREAMAEPLFIVADIDLSAPALRRWLKSAPQSVAAFDDWPESVRLGAPGITELAAPVEPCVADALVSYCVDSFGREDGHLHCRHDEQAHALRFAACFQYGDEAGAQASALFSAPCCAGWRRPTRQGSPHSSACSTPTTIWSASGSASSPRASCPLRRMRESRPMVRRLDQPGQPGRSGQAHGRAVPPWPAP